jgi:transcription antitermination factor NusG
MTVVLSETHSRSWHALHTRYQHEKAVAQVLNNKGFEAFLPLYSAVRVWKDRRKALSLPLFPCYVFIHGGLDRKLQILKTPGVHGIVETAGQPGVVSQAEIAAIQRALENSMAIEPYPYLQCGNRVKLRSGPLSGLEGILLRGRDRLRLVLSVEMLGRSVVVEVDISDVEPVVSPRNVPVPRVPPGSLRLDKIVV